ncbi:Hpt domain-containing protein [Algiphilus sp.]|uniref:Hpt domain-containing protein n=1 Tax=Algiphilus sp. TaxID=1872431 RepID=UPI003B519A61
MVYARPNLVAGMHWVRPQFGQNLTRARHLVEQYVEERTNAVTLREAVHALQEVGSSARVVQCAGISIAAAEVADALDALSRGDVEDISACGTAVMSAIMQLDDYADAVISGLPDHPLVLHPLLNELRVARGQPVLTEAEIFARQLETRGLQPEWVEPDASAPPAQAIAQKYEAVFQQALAQWLRHDAREGMARIGKLSEAFARGTRDAEQHALWRTVAAVAECGLAGGLDDSIDLKRLLGRTAAGVRALSGGQAFAEALSLARSLLLYVARASAGGSRARDLDEALGLREQLPTSQESARIQSRLRGTNTALIEQLSKELRSDLGKVKDHIDLRVRAGAGDMEAARALLDQIAHTLSMLGLPALSRVARNQMSLLSTLLAEDADATHEGWIDIASALLRIEVSLDEALFRQINRAADSEDAVALGEEIPNAADLQDSAQALLREAQVNLSRVKTAVDGLIRKGSTEGLDEAPQQIAQVAAALRVVQHEAIAERIARLAEIARERGLQTLCASEEGADRFADAVAVVDFYIERLMERSAPGQHLLDALSGLLAGFDEAEEAVLDAETPPSQERVTVDVPAADEVDPDIREVFLEEAREVQETIEAAFARWQRNPDDSEAMLEVRRGFHTLKGSGRMVEATALGEFAWACERLLNACRDGEIAVSPDIVACIGEAIAFVPEMVAAFAESRPIADQATHDALIERTERLRLGGVTDAEREDLLATFHEDAAAQLGLLSRWLRASPEGGQPVEADAARAFHTLRGSAAAVGHERFSRITGTAEQYVNALQRGSAVLPSEAQRVLSEIIDALRAGVDARNAEPDAEQTEAWLQALRELHDTLPAEDRAAAEDQAISDAFCMEALDALQAIDSRTRAWRNDPEGQHVPALRDGWRNLAATAANAGSVALVAPARAFERQLAQAEADGIVPDAAVFDALDARVEAFFQLLDAFREQGGNVDGSALAEQINALRWDGGAASAVSAEALPEADNIQVDNHADEDAAELRELFIGEAQELIEAIDSDLDQLDRQPDAIEPLRDLARSLHTLKGSARMAGFEAFGDVAHRCETLTSRLESDGGQLDTSTRSRLHNVCDGLYRAVETLRAGGTPDLHTLLEDLEGDAPAGTAPAPAEDAATASEADALPGQAAEGSLDDIAAAVSDHPALQDTAPELTDQVTAEEDADAPPAPSSEALQTLPQWPAWSGETFERLPPGPDAAEHAVSDEGVDEESQDIFREEATDLLDTIAQALSRWSGDIAAGVPASEAGAVIDLRRALHTLKGSAYLVGANAMGAAAHEMESLVEEVVQGDLDADSGTVMQLQTRLDQLQAIHDGTQPVSSGETADDSTYYDDADIAQLQQPWAPPEPDETGPVPETVETWTAVADVPSSAPDDASLAPMADAAPSISGAQPTAPGGDGESGWDPRVLWQPPQEDENRLGLKREVARVPVPDLESLLNKAGEISVLRARLDEQNAGIAHQLEEVVETVNRLRDQLRQLDGETEAQIEARGLQGSASEAVPDRYGKDFDPLEMDRYSRMQELSRALAETVGDIDVLQESMRANSGETEALLLQQQRINSDLQQGLMGTLMVPFARQTQRLQRVVRQTAQESDKEVRAHFEGEAIEVDRNVLERMTAPLEHTLRNAVVHGIEAPALRTQRGKPSTGTVSVTLSREGQQLRLEVADDGGGLDFEAIRRAAVDRGLMHDHAQLTQRQLALFILEPGFSTAPKLTQSAGRGVGMDVVAAEVRQLGGSLEIESEPEQGTRFIIRLPITLGLTQALMFEAGGETFAVPLTNIEGIARVSRSQAMPADGSEGVMQYGDAEYRIGFAADFLGLPRTNDSDARALPVVLLRLPEGVTDGSHHLALVMDHIIGNREVVSKTIGPVVAALPGMTGATVLPDGRIVLLLDLLTLVQDRIRRERIREAPVDTAEAQSTTPLVMVVDDSITMRRVAERLLLRNGYEVQLARDGVDAMAQLATARPQVVLLDIEMPRADGFEVASYMRNSDALRAVPIIMITSRSGDKHRERAKAFGVQRYLIKPYQEADLLNEIRAVRAEAEA